LSTRSRPALEQFGAHGFEAVGVGGLCASAGVTTGSLYHHFESKAGLYLLVRGQFPRRHGAVPLQGGQRG
jgi:AcrR family transcriptional regulator